ncbi:SRPBCC family protein [Devosia sp.]|uniref:SRPBCC family protein n=1 Tax=Devosia sp. TaxID=1871048 RepID=UPI003F70404F
MTDKSYTTSITVKQSPAAVFAAINNVRGWWSEDVQGSTAALGDVWYYEARDLHRSTLKVIESLPGSRVAWRVLDNHFSFVADKTEWIGTTIAFDIEPVGEGARLTFTHLGLLPDHECYDVCHDAWGTYIRGSLKALITSGKGYPNAGAEITAEDPATLIEDTRMTNDSFTTSFTVDQSPEAAFAAIIDPRAWWSGEFEGGTRKLGDVFSYRYQEFHYSRQVVTELVPGKRVAWQVVEGMLSFVEDKTEWVGTTITFDIGRKDGKTEVVFTHEGIAPAVECYDTCSDAWTSLIRGSLKQLIESGKTELIELAAPAA